VFFERIAPQLQNAADFANFAPGVPNCGPTPPELTFFIANSASE
jgi:hypothetical protein